MVRSDLKPGLHIWLKDTFCCGGYHQAGEECIIQNIDNPDSIYCKSVKTGASYWHELSCFEAAQDFFKDVDFEI